MLYTHGTIHFLTACSMLLQNFHAHYHDQNDCHYSIKVSSKKGEGGAFDAFSWSHTSSARLVTEDAHPNSLPFHPSCYLTLPYSLHPFSTPPSSLTDHSIHPSPLCSSSRCNLTLTIVDSKQLHPSEVSLAMVKCKCTASQ